MCLLITSSKVKLEYYHHLFWHSEPQFQYVRVCVVGISPPQEAIPCHQQEV